MTENDLDEIVTEDDVAAVEQRQDPSCLSVVELQFLVNIINAVTSRGAFKPEEFQDVGLIYRKIQAMIQEQTNR